MPEDGYQEIVSRLQINDLASDLSGSSSQQDVAESGQSNFTYALRKVARVHCSLHGLLARLRAMHKS
jgi:hypothetical protein